MIFSWGTFLAISSLLNPGEITINTEARLYTHLQKILIVAANYYPKISNRLIESAKNALDKNKILEIKKIIVPGIFEIPVVISQNIDKFDGFIALGCVIKGKTPHFDLITQAVTKAIMDLSIKHKKPIGNWIIASLNMKQAMERAGPIKKNKGKEAAEAVISVVDLF